MKYNLTDKKGLLSVLNKYGIRLDKESGQHFLICQEVVETTILALDNKTKQVTELGAGVGTLTGSLLEAGFEVRAIERDKSVAEVLSKVMPKSARNELQLVVNDLRNEAWEQVEPYQLVGNIPYNLSGLIVKKITQLDPAPERVILLVQREVAERIVAGVPDMSLIGLAVQLWGEAETLLNVPADCFFPPPKVDSQLIVLQPRQAEALDLAERERTVAMAKKFFQAKRKQVAGVAERSLGLNKGEVASWLAKAEVARLARPQEIRPDQWVALARAWYTRR